MIKQSEHNTKLFNKDTVIYCCELGHPQKNPVPFPNDYKNIYFSERYNMIMKVIKYNFPFDTSKSLCSSGFFKDI